MTWSRLWDTGEGREENKCRRAANRSGDHPVKWWLKRLLAIVSLFLAVHVVWTYVSILRAAGCQPSKPGDVIIVLGAGSVEGGPRPAYRARLDHALTLFQRGFADHIIVTERAPSAQGARDYLVAEGISEEAVLLEDKSTSTWQNLLFSRDIIRMQGWQAAIIVSCPYHIHRALRMAHDLDISAQGGAAGGSWLWTDARARSRMIWREIRLNLQYTFVGGV